MITLLLAACGGGEGDESQAAEPSAPGPSSEVQDELGFANWAIVELEEPALATVEWGETTFGPEDKPARTAIIRYPKATFTVTDQDCDNTELSINGERISGTRFSLAPDGATTVVSHENQAVLALEALKLDVPDPLPGE